MYKGPMDKDNGGQELKLGDRGWAGQGRAMGENEDNYNCTTIKKLIKNIFKKKC